MTSASPLVAAASTYATARAVVEASAFARGMLAHLEPCASSALETYFESLFLPMIEAEERPVEEVAACFLDLTTRLLRHQAASESIASTGNAAERLSGLAFVFWPSGWRTLRFLEERVLALPRNEEGRCLDVACGPGVLASRVGRSHPRWSMTAVDSAPHAIRRTARMWQASGLSPARLTTRRADSPTLLAETATSWDTILFSGAIEHLPDGPEVLRQLATRLATDGVLFFSTTINNPHADHQHWRSLDECRDAIVAAGLALLDLEVHEGGVTPHGPQCDINAVLVRPGSPWLARRRPETGGHAHHLGLVTGDLDRAIARWLRRGAQLRQAPVVDLGMDCTVAFLDAPVLDHPLELISPYSPDSPLARRVHNTGFDHLAINSADLDAEIARREAHGDRLVYGPVESAALRRRVAFLLDGDGLLTELVAVDLERPWII